MREKIKGLIYILIAYVISFLIGFQIYEIFRPTNIFYAIFLMDVFMTILIYLFSYIVKNSSVYDPYWSLTPLLILIMVFIKEKSFDITAIIFMIIFALWGIRLTINWVITFSSLSKEDWRYAAYRTKYKKTFEFINFFGIMFFPTILVYLAMIPSIAVLIYNPTFNPIHIIAYVVMLIGIAFEFFADRSVHRFLKEDNDKKAVCKKGLWKYSRHPNYFGEIIFWFGNAILGFLINPTNWFYYLGFVLIYLLFRIVSIPLMEKRQLSRREDYFKYRKDVSALFPTLWRRPNDVD